ncbi:hypothetical protein Tco_0038260, partial [Tanacetum coccineum]
IDKGALDARMSCLKGHDQGTAATKPRLPDRVLKDPSTGYAHVTDIHTNSTAPHDVGSPSLSMDTGGASSTTGYGAAPLVVRGCDGGGVTVVAAVVVVRVAAARVRASGYEGWIDPVMGSDFGLGRKCPPEKFSGGGGMVVAGGGLPAMRERVKVVSGARKTEKCQAMSFSHLNCFRDRASENVL